MVLKYEYDALCTYYQNSEHNCLLPHAMAKVSALLEKVLRPGYARAPRFPRGKKPCRLNVRDRPYEPRYEPKPKAIKDLAKELQDDLRKLFNKLTGSKYEDLVPKLRSHVELMKSSPGFTPDAVLSVLFTVIENTPFYSRMYGKCYAELAKDSAFLISEVERRRQKFLESLNTIESVNPNVDYDKFCEVNKENSKRQAMAKFLVAMVEEDMEGHATLSDLLEGVLDKFYEKMHCDDERDVVDALANLVGCIIIDNNFAKKKLDGTDLHSRILNVSEMKASHAVSLTNKAVFKFMDVVDFFRASE